VLGGARLMIRSRQYSEIIAQTRQKAKCHHHCATDFAYILTN
jgi:transposase